jgi:hypothetical protein
VTEERPLASPEFGFPDQEIEACYRTTLFAELKPSVAGLLVDEQGDIWVGSTMSLPATTATF